VVDVGGGGVWVAWATMSPPRMARTKLMIANWKARLPSRGFWSSGTGGRLGGGEPQPGGGGAEMVGPSHLRRR
jgi:hypothetical protein